MRAGFIGLGAMGEAMARNLHRAGFLDAVWNRTASKARSLAEELGIDLAPFPDALAATVDVVFLCVSADRDVLDMIEAVVPGLGASGIVVDLSTVSVDTARRAAEQVRNRGGDFLDAPVSGGVEGARSGTLAIMAGGSASTLGTVMPMLRAMSSRVIHIGPVGSGQAAKAVNQVMVAGINQAVTEALAFGDGLGLDLQKVIDVVSGGAAANWFLDKRGLTMIRGSFQPGFKLALHHKDLEICRSMAERIGITLPLVRKTLDDYRALMDRGFGNEDISALYRLKTALKPGQFVE